MSWIIPTAQLMLVLCQNNGIVSFPNHPTHFQTIKFHFHMVHFQLDLWQREFEILLNSSSLPSRARTQSHHPCLACNSHFLPWLRTTHMHPQLLALLHNTFWAWYVWGTPGIRWAALCSWPQIYFMRIWVSGIYYKYEDIYHNLL